MLALGRALATNPKVLLVDELSLGLAPLVRERLLSFLRQVADAGTAVLVVEQSVEALITVADRTYVLRRGEIIDHRPADQWHGSLADLGRIYLS
jgi:branched-chain amino acid transport system ATP-binding protein